MKPEPPRLPDTFNWWDVRSALEDWFFRIFRDQSSVQPGTIAAFGTATAPEGWVLCDGTEYEQTKYNELYLVIRQDYGGGAGTFRVPNSVALAWPAVGAAWIIKV